jgi:hypothetical protein
MLVKSTVVLFTVILLAGAVFSQATRRANDTKTVRLHIDGFMKSKSGSI